MRIAVLSDIHSNIFALEAVLSEVRRHRIDIVVNLGDTFYGPIAPKATYECLMQHAVVSINGNQDSQIVDAVDSGEPQHPTMAFVIDDLPAAALDWMRQLPAAQRLDGDVLLCHGTPSDDLTYLLEDTRSGQAQLRAQQEIVNLLAGEHAGLILCGHSHTPRVVSIGPGQLIVNPGSVGLQAYSDDEPWPHVMQSYSPHAQFAIVTQTAHGWQVEQLRVAYDYQQAAAAAAKRQRDDWVSYLSTGRAD